MIIPESNMLKNAVFESNNTSLVKLTLFITKTIIITIDNIVLDIHEKAAVRRKVFNTLFSFVLYANIIEKNIIDKNIKNSTMISNIISAKTSITEKFPSIIKDKSILSVSNIVGVINTISKDIVTVIKPSIVSIRDVRYLEVRIWFLVTGRVCVR